MFSSKDRIPKLRVPPQLLLVLTHHHCEHHIILFCPRFSHTTHALSHLFRAYHIPGTVLGTRDKLQTKQSVCFHGIYILIATSITADIHCFGGTGHCTRCFTYITSFHLQTTTSKVLLLPSITDEKTEAQRL